MRWTMSPRNIKAPSIDPDLTQPHKPSECASVHRKDRKQLSLFVQIMCNCLQQRRDTKWFCENRRNPQSRKLIRFFLMFQSRGCNEFNVWPEHPKRLDQ